MTKLLITAQKRLILWDGKPHTIYESQGLCYGLSWNDEFIFLGDRGAPTERVIQHFDHNLNPLGFLEFTNLGLDVHQLFYYGGCLYIANRDMFRVESCNLDTGEQSFIQWTHIDQHINSIWCDGVHFFVLEHRQSRIPKVVRIFDLDWRSVAKHHIYLKPQHPKTGFGAHNVYMECNSLFVLAPDQVYVAKLRSFDDVEYAAVHNINGPAERPYYRGLARTKGVFYVGVSATTERAHRGEGDSYIYMLNSLLGLLDVICLPNTGQILEVRALEDDQAHNGIRCPYV